MSSLPASHDAPLPRRAVVLGVGCMLFAAAWCVVGWWLFAEVGTRTMMMALNEVMTQSVEYQSRQQPVAPPPKVQQPTANPLGVLTWQSPPPSNQPPVRTPGPPAGPIAEKPRARFRGEIAEPTRMIWAVLTFCCAAALSVCGASALAGSYAGRRRIRRTVALLFVASLTGLVAWRVTQHRPGREWLVHLLAITQSRFVWAGFLTLALLASTIVSTFALSRMRRFETLRFTSIGVVLFGTLLTLVGIGVLIEFAGFPSLPAWFYAVAALSQSSWAWLLLMIGPIESRAIDAVVLPPARRESANSPQPAQTHAGDAINY